MIDPKNLNKCCPTNDGNVGKAIHSLSNRIKYLERANSDIENSLDEEKSRAIDVENTLQQHIEEEQNRASTKEEEILLELNEEQTRAKNAELALSNKIDENIETERNRATNVETTISSNLTDEIEARKQAITNVINSIPNAQILSDWNLTDSNAKDYIKNKPRTLDGKSAYELAVDNGFEGTEQEWLASLKGSQGIQGEQGETGPQGQKGETGETGPQGPQGLKGDTGEGFSIYRTYRSIADMVDDAANVPEGKFVIITSNAEDPDNAKLYVRGSLYFTFVTDMSGAQGIQGPQGEQGIQGVQGPAGRDGSNGADGHSPVVTASKSGSTTTIYVDGTSIATIEDGLDGQNGQNGTNGTNGTDGITPHIDSTTGNWFIGTTNTGVHAQGPAGLDGSNGTNGSNGQDGHTPVITASKSNGVTTVSVDGTAIATINDGQNGSNGTNGTNGTDGNDGTDGITPTVNVTAISNGHNVAFSYGTGDSRNVDFDVMNGDVANLLQADWNLTNSSYADYIKNKPTLFSGSYNDLTDKPTIPSAPDLTNYIQKSSTSGLLKNDGTVDTNTYLTSHQDISGKANSADLATVATSGSYADLSNKPTIPDAQIQSDWNQTDNTAKDYIKNKPTIPTVPSNQSAVYGGSTLSVVTTGEKYTWNNKSDFSGSYDDLTNKPIELIATGDYHRQLESLGTGTFFAYSIYTYTIGSQLYKMLNFNTDTNIFQFVAGGVITILNRTGSDLVICSDKFTSNNRINGFCFNCNSASDINNDNIILLNSSFCYCDEVPFPDDSYITILAVPTSLDNYCAAIISNGEFSWKNKASVWRGTQAQYDALSSYDSNTIYIITAS